jgi:glycosyltransferase involved in cell wall biosynthesis
LEPRPAWFRRLARYILAGLRKAAVVFCSTAAVRDQLLLNEVVEPGRLVSAPYGVAAEFTPYAAEPVTLPVRVDSPFLLHVGSPIPRKRLDVLLDIFAAVRARAPDVRLVQVGGPWPGPLAAGIERMGIGPAVTQIRGLGRPQLAELYRRAAIVLVPSEAEGFGLPVIEALACGAPVIASDIPPLREAGGRAAAYCPVADVPTWTGAVLRSLADDSTAADRAARLSHAAQYSWTAHARTIGDAYLRLAGHAAEPAEAP